MPRCAKVAPWHASSSLLHTGTPAQAEAPLSDDLGRLLPDAPAGLDARADAAVAFACPARAAASAGAKRDRAVPHPLAEWWLLKRLGDRLGRDDWKTWKPDDVRAAAAAELAARTALLQARGAPTVLPD